MVRSVRVRLVVVVALALGLAVVALGAASAEAHAMLVESVPADGAVVPAPPDAVILRFNEPVRPIAVRLLDGQGRSLVAAKDSPPTFSSIRLPFTASLRPGPCARPASSPRGGTSTNSPTAGRSNLNTGLREFR